MFYETTKLYGQTHVSFQVTIIAFSAQHSGYFSRKHWCCSGHSDSDNSFES